MPHLEHLVFLDLKAILVQSPDQDLDIAASMGTARTQSETLGVAPSKCLTANSWVLAYCWFSCLNIFTKIPHQILRKKYQ